MNPADIPHISVCICTYQRPKLLYRLLGALTEQVTEGHFTYSIVVADNDAERSAEPVVAGLVPAYPLELAYAVEPRQNIALARNCAFALAKGRFIAFIDDDEYPIRNWLLNLWSAAETYKADGVLGPVKPDFETPPARWIRAGRLFERPEHITGFVMPWRETRSGNVLFKREIVNGAGPPFREQFGTGSEDVDFFRRMVLRGRVFIWCNEAVVYETIPRHRMTRRFQLRLALLRGGNSLRHENPNRLMDIMKSYAALVVYGLSLPVLFVLGNHLFMEYLIKTSDHAGKILQLLGLNPIKRRGA